MLRSCQPALKPKLWGRIGIRNLKERRDILNHILFKRLSNLYSRLIVGWLTTNEGRAPFTPSNVDNNCTVAIWSYYLFFGMFWCRCRCQWIAGQHYIAVQCESHGRGRLWVKLTAECRRLDRSNSGQAGPGGAEARQWNAGRVTRLSWQPAWSNKVISCPPATTVYCQQQQVAAASTPDTD